MQVHCIKYIGDFKEFLTNLQNGTVFIAHTVEDVLLNRDGKQLVCEAMYLAGTMLLNLDRLCPGPTRERLIVCYLRKRGESLLQNFDEVQKLCRDTGFRPRSQNRPHDVVPKNYPESYEAFERKSKQNTKKNNHSNKINQVLCKIGNARRDCGARHRQTSFR